MGPPEIRPHEWLPIIAESLVKSDLVALCKKLGVSFPGHRMETLDVCTLALPLAEDASSAAPRHRDIVVEWLGRANQMIAEKARGMSVGKLRDAVYDPQLLGRTVTHGRLLWVLRNDPRATARRLADGISSAAREEYRLMPEEPVNAPPADPVVQKAVSEIRDAADRLAALTVGQGKRVERDEKRIESLEAQVDDLKKQVAARDERLAARRTEHDSVRAELSAAESELTALRARLKSQPPESWDSERRRLDHEARSLKKEIEEANAANRSALESAEREWTKRLEAEKLAAEAARREADMARREAAWLREKLKIPVAPPAPPPRDPDRVAVFIETQSLYPLSIARHTRIDYRKVLETCLKGRRLGRALAYVVEVPGTDPSSFKQKLQSQGFQVRARPGRNAGVWTAGLETDLRDAARSCGRLCVATANAELAGAIGAISAEGTPVILVCFDDPSIAPLRAAAGEFIPIDAEMLRPMPARA